MTSKQKKQTAVHRNAPAETAEMSPAEAALLLLAKTSAADTLLPCSRGWVAVRKLQGGLSEPPTCRTQGRPGAGQEDKALGESRRGLSLLLQKAKGPQRRGAASPFVGQVGFGC